MNRHAYLIIAYEQPQMLQLLISALDDPRNDIFVHIDKKSKIDPSQLSIVHSQLSIIKSIDARWGDVSLVEVELLLFEAALQHGPYTYLHLLSDSDYPIKSQDYIHAECEQLSGREFIGFSEPEADELEVKMHRYHLFPRDFRNEHTWHHVIRKTWLVLQDVVGYRRHRNMLFRKGPQWWSITSDRAAKVLQHKDAILSTYHHTFCPDEVFMQTLCWHSKYKERIVKAEDEFIGCRRYIQWQNNIIRSFQEDDIRDLLDSPCWFARKFEEGQLPFLRRIEKSMK